MSFRVSRALWSSKQGHPYSVANALAPHFERPDCRLFSGSAMPYRRATPSLVGKLFFQHPIALSVSSIAMIYVRTSKRIDLKGLEIHDWLGYRSVLFSRRRSLPIDLGGSDLSSPEGSHACRGGKVWVLSWGIKCHKDTIMSSRWGWRS